MKKLFTIFLVFLLILSGCTVNTSKHNSVEQTNSPAVTETSVITQVPVITEAPATETTNTSNTAVITETPTVTETPETTVTPTIASTEKPTATIASTPTKAPVLTATPTAKPTEKPTPRPTVKPTEKPTPIPTAKPTPTPTPKAENAVTSSMLQKIETEFLRLVNNERSRVGVNTLTINSHLDSCAVTRSKEIIQSFSHTRPDGTSCFTLVDSEKYNYNALGENIAKTSHVGNGYITPFDGSDAQLEAVATHMFTLFKNSPGHYENMINGNFEHCGIGISYEFDESAGIPAFYCAHLFGADFN